MQAKSACMPMNQFTDAEELCGVYFIYMRKSTKAVIYTAALIFLMGLLMAAFLPASVCLVHITSSLLFSVFSQLVEYHL